MTEDENPFIDPARWSDGMPPEFNKVELVYRINAEAAEPNLEAAKAELDAFTAGIRELISLDAVLLVTAFRFLPDGRRRIEAAKESIVGYFKALSMGVAASMVSPPQPLHNDDDTT